MAIKKINYNKFSRNTLVNIFSVTLFSAFILSFLFILISHLVSIVTTYYVVGSPEVSEDVVDKNVIDLGIPFEIKKDEVVSLRNTDFKLKITGFINSPCPKDAKCVWSGTAVLYEVTLGDVVYKGSSERADLDIPYNILIKDSDYTSYAKVIINEK